VSPGLQSSRLHVTDNNSAAKRLRAWWASPPRTGRRLIIAPWEYRHLRAWARVRIISGVVSAALGIVTFSLGGDDWQTYGWTIAFLAMAAASWAFAYWLLSVARGEASKN
jgi:hypothetical protein